MVQSEFPEFTLVQNDSSTGYIVRRNQAAQLSSTPYLVSLDDDAVFSSADVLGQTLRMFDNDRIGAVAIPLVDVRDGPEVKQKAPDKESVYLCERFKGTAYAVRRDVFNRLDGFRECFLHQGEEGDFCIRLLQFGFVVRLGYGDPIRHYESERRDFSRVDHYGRRNDILFAWFNVPLVFLLPHIAAVVWLGLRYGLCSGRFGAMVKGIGAGFVGIGQHFGERKAVSISTYLVSRRLKRANGTNLNDLGDSVRERST
jgi:GT2 family glycosyltransferase